MFHSDPPSLQFGDLLSFNCDVGIRDAVTLPRNRVLGDKLFLFTAKTGTPVYCPLPPIVMNALNAIPDSTYYFWTGLSKPKSAVGDCSAV
jgi:integrase/recombinase XerD